MGPKRRDKSMSINTTNLIRAVKNHLQINYHKLKVRNFFLKYKDVNFLVILWESAIRSR